MQLEGAAAMKAEEHRARSLRKKASKDPRGPDKDPPESAPACKVNGNLHPAHDRVWPPSMREREPSPEQDGGTNSLFGGVPTRRRSGYELREIPVNEGFHIMNITQPGFPLEDHRPFVTPFPLQGPDKWRGVSPPRRMNAMRKNPEPNHPPLE